MNQWFRVLGVSSALLMLSLVATTPAVAEENALRFYAKAFGGVGTLDEVDLESNALGDGRASFDGGFSGGGAIGVERGPWAAELELVYRTNDLDRARGGSFGGLTDGEFSSLGVGVIGLRYFNLLPNPKVQTYLGAGVARFQEIDIDFEDGVERSYSGEDWAVQLLLGARYDFSRRWRVHAEARYLQASSVGLDAEGAAVGEIDADYARTSLELGLSYRF